MEKFKTFDGQLVDLEDSKTFEHLPKSVKKLQRLILAEIGYYNCFKIRNKKWFNDDKQKKRVKKLIKKFIKNEFDNVDNVLWYQQQIYVFQDEIENICF